MPARRDDRHVPAERLVGQQIQRPGAGPGDGVRQPPRAQQLGGLGGDQADALGGDALGAPAGADAQFALEILVVCPGKLSVAGQAQRRHSAYGYGLQAFGGRDAGNVQVAGRGHADLSGDGLGSGVDYRQAYLGRGAVGLPGPRGGDFPHGDRHARDALGLHWGGQEQLERSALAFGIHAVLEALVRAVDGDDLEMPLACLVGQVEGNFKQLAPDGGDVEPADKHKLLRRDHEPMAGVATGSQRHAREVQLDLPVVRPVVVKPALSRGEQAGDHIGPGKVAAKCAADGLAPHAQLPAGIDEQVALLEVGVYEANRRARPRRAAADGGGLYVHRLGAPAGGAQADDELLIGPTGGRGRDVPLDQGRAAYVGDRVGRGHKQRKLANAAAKHLGGVQAVESRRRGRELNRRGAAAQQDRPLVLLPTVAHENDRHAALSADCEPGDGLVGFAVVFQIGHGRDRMHLEVAGGGQRHFPGRGGRQGQAELHPAAAKLGKARRAGNGELVGAPACDYQHEPAI